MEDLEVPQAAIFDLDGTLLDSVDLHALAWHEAMIKFGHDVSFEQARSQIGKGGDKLIPEFLSEDAQRDHGKELEEWRGQRASRPSIFRWCAPSRRCPTCCGGSAMPACASPSVRLPRRTN
jgi:phosphoglycolate phosphatase-like HAD superfamily hydrolase